MYCIKCGTVLPENAYFCSNCGARVEQRLQTNNMMEYYRSVLHFSYTNIEPTDDNWYNIKDGKSIVYLKAFNESGCTLFTFDGIPVFQEKYDDYGCFISKKGVEYFKVKKDLKWAIRTKERLLSSFDFDEVRFIWNCSIDGTACVMNNNMYGIFHLETGRLVFDFCFEDLGSSCVQWPKEFIAAKKNNKWGVINIQRGTIVKSFDYDHEHEVFNNNPSL